MLRLAGKAAAKDGDQLSEGEFDVFHGGSGLGENRIAPGNCRGGDFVIGDGLPAEEVRRNVEEFHKLAARIERAVNVYHGVLGPVFADGGEACADRIGVFHVVSVWWS